MAVIAMGTGFSRFILGSHRGEKKQQSSANRLTRPLVGRSQGQGQETGLWPAFSGKVDLCRVWQENNEIRMVPEKHRWTRWGVSEHCAFSKDHHFPGHCLSTQSTQLHSRAHTTVPSSE